MPARVRGASQPPLTPDAHVIAAPPPGREAPGTLARRPTTRRASVRELGDTHVTPARTHSARVGNSLDLPGARRSDLGADSEVRQRPSHLRVRIRSPGPREGGAAARRLRRRPIDPRTRAPMPTARADPTRAAFGWQLRLLRCLGPRQPVSGGSTHGEIRRARHRAPVMCAICRAERCSSPVPRRRRTAGRSRPVR